MHLFEYKYKKKALNYLRLLQKKLENADNMQNIITFALGK